MKISKISILTFILWLAGICPPSVVCAQVAETRAIFFPTDHRAVVTDSFGDGRTGHLHEGVDIMGEKMMPLYAAVDGFVESLVIPEASYGYAIGLEDSDGYVYNYLHVNNDTPGTDDGKGGIANAYAPGITEGARVSKGDLIGWMGDSGNAEAAGAHLHFEIRQPDREAIDPYPSLIAALNPAVNYDIADALSSSTDINTDKSLTVKNEAACESGSLVKLSGAEAVYYCGADGKRYVFPNEKIYFTWYDDFSGVTEISADNMAGLPLGGNVTYRPGVKMIKIQTDPKVYAVAKGGVLRWIRSPDTAAKLYGADWKKSVDDLPDSFFFDYRVGAEI